MDNIVYLNGEYIPSKDAKVSVFDRALRMADAVFDTERTFAGKIFKLENHLERLARSLHMVRIDPGMTMNQLKDITLETLARNESLRGPNDDFWITQRITRGVGLNPISAGPPTVIVEVYPLEFEAYASFYETGAHVVTPSTRASSPDIVDPKIKHISRLNMVLADIEAKQVDPTAYMLLLDSDGNIAEGTGSNFFIVSDGVIRTPRARNVLEGISRETVRELASQLGIEYVEEDLQQYHLYNADEAFLSTTSYCVLPVSKVNGQLLKNDTPGPVSKRLLSAWSELVGVDIVGQALSHIRDN